MTELLKTVAAKVAQIRARAVRLRLVCEALPPVPLSACWEVSQGPAAEKDARVPLHLRSSVCSPASLCCIHLLICDPFAGAARGRGCR